MWHPLQLGSVEIDPPLVNATGAFNIHAKLPQWRADPAAARHLGAYVVKTLTLYPTPGNPEPQIAKYGDGLVNSVGLMNSGVAAALDVWGKDLAELEIPIIVSVAGNPRELELIADEIAKATLPIVALELNLSCPNVGGTKYPNFSSINECSTALRAATELPILAKVGAVESTIADVVRGVEAAGLNAIVAINSVPIEAVDADGNKLLGTPIGGQSGPAIFDQALRCVSIAAENSSLPVIGVGGIASVEDAQAMHDAGASAIGVGTSALFNPALVKALADYTHARVARA